MSKPQGFISLTSLKQGGPDPTTALAEIRRIYFNTTRQTIQHDFAHAIELLKSLPAEEDREKASVYMEGLSEMRSDWARGEPSTGKREKGKGGKRKGTERRTPKR